MKKIILILSEEQWCELEDMRCHIHEYHIRVPYKAYLQDVKDNPEKYTILFG
jgi:hypothetical protein